jgi:hypothetical protein
MANTNLIAGCLEKRDMGKLASVFVAVRTSTGEKWVQQTDYMSSVHDSDINHNLNLLPARH